MRDYWQEEIAPISDKPLAKQDKDYWAEEVLSARERAKDTARDIEPPQWLQRPFRAIRERFAPRDKDYWAEEVSPDARVEDIAPPVREITPPPLDIPEPTPEERYGVIREPTRKERLLQLLPRDIRKARRAIIAKLREADEGRVIPVDPAHQKYRLELPTGEQLIPVGKLDPKRFKRDFFYRPDVPPDPAFDRSPQFEDLPSLGAIFDAFVISPAKSVLRRWKEEPALFLDPERVGEGMSQRILGEIEAAIGLVKIPIEEFTPLILTGLIAKVGVSGVQAQLAQTKERAYASLARGVAFRLVEKGVPAETATKIAQQFVGLSRAHTVMKRTKSGLLVPTKKDPHSIRELWRAEKAIRPKPYKPEPVEFTKEFKFKGLPRFATDRFGNIFAGGMSYKPSPSELALAKKGQVPEPTLRVMEKTLELPAKSLTVERALPLFIEAAKVTSPLTKVEKEVGIPLAGLPLEKRVAILHRAGQHEAAKKLEEQAPEIIPPVPPVPERPAARELLAVEARGERFAKKQIDEIIDYNAKQAKLPSPKYREVPSAKELVAFHAQDVKEARPVSKEPELVIEEDPPALQQRVSREILLQDIITDKLYQVYGRFWKDTANAAVKEGIVSEEEVVRIAQALRTVSTSLSFEQIDQMRIDEETGQPGFEQAELELELGIRALANQLTDTIWYAPEKKVQITPHFPERPAAKLIPKEPWQMTRAEYVRPPYTSPAMHEFGVEKALREGKPVPPEVLADYPDLAEAIPPVVPGVKPIPKELEPLAVRAREYKSLIEFVEKGLPRELYYPKDRDLYGLQTREENNIEVLRRDLKRGGTPEQIRNRREMLKVSESVVETIKKIREAGFNTYAAFHAQAVKEVKPATKRPLGLPGIKEFFVSEPKPTLDITKKAGHTISEGGSNYYEISDTKRKDLHRQKRVSKLISSSPLKVKYKKQGYFKFPQEKISSPADVAFAFRELKNEAVEKLYVIGIKNNVPISIEPISVGTIDAGILNPFEALHLLLSKKADSYYLVHNHPSGNVEWSEGDVISTDKFKSAFIKHGLRFKGHVIINHGKYGLVPVGPDRFRKKTVFPLPEHLKTLKKVPQYSKYIEWTGDASTQLLTASAVAGFIKGLNSDWEKNIFAIYLNTHNDVIASEILNPQQVTARNLAETAVSVRAPQIILVNASKANKANLPEGIPGLVEDLERYPIRLVDSIDFKDKDTFVSAKGLGLIGEKEVPYRPTETETGYGDIPKTDQPYLDFLSKRARRTRTAKAFENKFDVRNILYDKKTGEVEETVAHGEKVITIIKRAGFKDLKDFYAHATKEVRPVTREVEAVKAQIDKQTAVRKFLQDYYNNPDIYDSIDDAVEINLGKEGFYATLTTLEKAKAKNFLDKVVTTEDMYTFRYMTKEQLTKYKDDVTAIADIGSKVIIKPFKSTEPAPKLIAEPPVKPVPERPPAVTATKKKPTIAAKKRNVITLFSDIAKRGISPSSIRALGYNVREDFIEQGLLRILRKGGMGLDSLATEYVELGWIVPEGHEHPSETLVRYLKDPELRKITDEKISGLKSEDEKFDREYAEHMRGEVEKYEDARRAERDIAKDVAKEVEAETVDKTIRGVEEEVKALPTPVVERERVVPPVKEPKTLLSAPIELKDKIKRREKIVVEPFQKLPRQITDFDSPVVYKLLDDSPVLANQKEINKIRGKRLAGTIDAKTANQRVFELKKKIRENAKAEGIAIVDGKPVIRKSGVFAPEKFTTHNFKDIKGKLAFNLDDAVLAIDNKTFREIAVTGIGPLSEIQAAKMQATARLHNFGPEEADKVIRSLKKHNIPINEKSGIQATLVAHGLTNIDIDNLGAKKAISDVLLKADIAPEVAKQSLEKGFLQKIRGKESKLIEVVKDGIPNNIFNLFDADLRPQLNSLRDRANAVRNALGKDEIPFRKNYGPIIQQTGFWSNLRNVLKTTITDNFDFVIPNAKKNPHALMRKGGTKDLEWNFWKLLPRYHEAIAQDIFHTPIIEQLKAVNTVLQARGNVPNAVDFINRNIRENIVGHPGQLDAFFGITKGTKLSAALNSVIRARTTAALAFNIVWTTFTQPASQALTIGKSVIGTPSPLGLVYGPLDMAKGYIKWVTDSTYRAKINKLPTIQTKTAGKSIGRTGLGDIDALGTKIMKTKWDTVDNFLGQYANVMEYHLTGAAASVGHEMSARQGATGVIADFLADWLGGSTQSRYNREARPLIQNNLLMRANFPFNTFLLEFYRLNKTILGRPGGMPLGGWERFNVALLLLGGMWLWDRFVTEPILGRRLLRPSVFIPIIGREVEVLLNEGIKASGLADKEIPIITPVLDRLGLGKDDTVLRPAGALYRDVHSFIRAVNSWVEHENIQPLRKEMVRWGMGFKGHAGASTLNRFVDGLIANSTGYMKSRTGRKLFRIEGLDRYRSVLLGPFATRAGIEFRTEGGSILIQDARQELRRLRLLPREQAKLKFNILINQSPELARRVNILIEDEANPILAEVRGLGIRNGMRAERIVEELEKLPAKRRREEFQKLIDAGVVTEKVSLQVQTIMEEQNNAVQGILPNIKNKLWSDKSLIRTISLYAQAIGTDPITALNRMLAGERIIRITGGAIITERMTVEESQRVRRQRASKLGISPQELLTEWRLDHIIPKGLGGSDREDNLVLVSTEEWETYTPVEHHLIRLLKAGKIERRKAQRLIKKFKKGIISASDILNLK